MRSYEMGLKNLPDSRGHADKRRLRNWAFFKDLTLFILKNRYNAVDETFDNAINFDLSAFSLEFQSFMFSAFSF